MNIPAGTDVDETVKLTPRQVRSIVLAAAMSPVCRLENMPPVAQTSVYLTLLSGSETDLGGFRVWWTRLASGSCRVQTELVRSKTSQSTFLLIPVSRKKVLALGGYQAAARRLRDVLRTVEANLATPVATEASAARAATPPAGAEETASLWSASTSFGDRPVPPSPSGPAPAPAPAPPPPADPAPPPTGSKLRGTMGRRPPA